MLLHMKFGEDTLGNGAMVLGLVGQRTKNTQVEMVTDSEDLHDYLWKSEHGVPLSTKDHTRTLCAPAGGPVPGVNARRN